MTSVVILDDDLFLVEDCNGKSKAMERAIGGCPVELGPRAPEESRLAASAGRRPESRFKGYFIAEAEQIGWYPNDVGFVVARKLGFATVAFLPRHCMFGPLLITSAAQGASLTELEVQEIRTLFAEALDEPRR